jgi:hypothetical protein
MSEPDEKAVLADWAGLMRSGSVRTHVNMNYSFLFRIKLQDATSGARETPTPTAEDRSSASPPAGTH